MTVLATTFGVSFDDMPSVECVFNSNGIVHASPIKGDGVRLNVNPVRSGAAASNTRSVSAGFALADLAQLVVGEIGKILELLAGQDHLVQPGVVGVAFLPRRVVVIALGAGIDDEATGFHIPTPNARSGYGRCWASS